MKTHPHLPPFGAWRHARPCCGVLWCLASLCCAGVHARRAVACACVPWRSAVRPGRWQVQAYAAAPLVAAVGAPVLLISGVHDEVTPFALSQQHDAFANATRRRMALLPRSAHVPAPEDWPDLRREVLAFLDPAAPTPDADVPPPSPQVRLAEGAALGGEGGGGAGLASVQGCP